MIWQQQKAWLAMAWMLPCTHTWWLRVVVSWDLKLSSRPVFKHMLQAGIPLTWFHMHKMATTLDGELFMWNPWPVFSFETSVLPELLVSNLKCRYMLWLGLFGRLNFLPGAIVDKFTMAAVSVFRTKHLSLDWYLLEWKLSKVTIDSHVIKANKLLRFQWNLGWMTA